MSFILADACVVTVNRANDVYERASVLVRGNRIANLGSKDELRAKEPNAAVIDCCSNAAPVFALQKVGAPHGRRLDLRNKNRRAHRLIKNGDELYGVTSRRKFATIKNDELYSLAGAPLGLTLADLNDDADALVKFKTRMSQAAA